MTLQIPPPKIVAAYLARYGSDEVIPIPNDGDIVIDVVIAVTQLCLDTQKWLSSESSSKIG